MNDETQATSLKNTKKLVNAPLKHKLKLSFKTVLLIYHISCVAPSNLAKGFNICK